MTMIYSGWKYSLRRLSDEYGHRGQRAWLYAETGQWDKAIADFSKVIELDPDNQQVLLPSGGAASLPKLAFGDGDRVSLV